MFCPDWHTPQSAPHTRRFWKIFGRDRYQAVQKAVAVLPPHDSLEWAMGVAMRGDDVIWVAMPQQKRQQLLPLAAQVPRPGFLGLVPRERSTGATARRAGLTLAGNRRARRVLAEIGDVRRFDNPRQLMGAITTGSFLPAALR